MTEMDAPGRRANLRPYERATEAELAKAMSLGDDDPRAWAEFRTRYSLEILSFVKLAGGNGFNDEDALDCMCVVEEHILRSVHRFTPRRQGALKSWCVKIAQNVVIDFLEKRGKRIEDLFASPEEVEQQLDSNEWWREAGESHEDPEQTRSRRHHEEEVHQAFARLAPDEQTVIQLSVNTDWSDARIAGLIGRRVDQLRQFRARAVDKLAKLLGRKPVKRWHKS
jgi:RNA polymerase sigma factor (sigma-70 family)